MVFRCDLKEILGQQLLYLKKAFATFPPIVKAFAVHKKSSEGPDMARGRIVFMPALNAHKPKHCKT